MDLVTGLAGGASAVVIVGAVMTGGYAILKPKFLRDIDIAVTKCSEHHSELDDVKFEALGEKIDDLKTGVDSISQRIDRCLACPQRGE